MSDTSLFDVLQEQTLVLIRDKPTTDKEALERAEFLTTQMQFALAYAHRHLAFNEQDQAEKFFNLAEEAAREAFNVEIVSVARFTEDAKPYKLALGSILSAGKSGYVRLSLCDVLCRIQKIDPDKMRKLYRKWQAEPDMQAGEVHQCC